MNFSRIGGRIREQMQGFLRKLSLPKVAKRFVLEAVYGIQTRQSVRLSEIARSLNESIPLGKTVSRLSRQAARPDLHKELTRFVMREGAPRIGDRTLLVVDPSDLRKKHARKMEHLSRVRDGSEHDFGQGYWLCDVIGVECGGAEVTPLAHHLWSHEAPDFQSENQEILGLIDAVSTATEKRGVWVIDRGGDRIKILEPLIHRDLEFIVRLQGNRHLLYRGRPRKAEALAHSCPTRLAETVRRQNLDGTETVRTLEYGCRKVRLPEHDRPLYLVVVKGFGEKPLMILTTIPLRNTYNSVGWLLEAYLTRWRIEETLRFAKQTYDIEDVRVLSYQRLRNMMALVLVAMYFAMAHLGARSKLAVLCRHALKAAKRLFGIPDFMYYAVADGLREILGKAVKPPFDHRAANPPPSAQLELFQLSDT